MSNQDGNAINNGDVKEPTIFQNLKTAIKGFIGNKYTKITAGVIGVAGVAGVAFVGGQKWEARKSACTAEVVTDDSVEEFSAM